MILRKATLVLSAFLALTALCLPAQAQRQLPDLTFGFDNPAPAYGEGKGPALLLSTTNNSYVQRGSMDPFSRLAATDGFMPILQEKPLKEALGGFDGILVIANPYLDNYGDYPAMEPPSAFSDEDIEAIRSWVENGGSMLLLADHSPFGGGSSKLAAAFGFTFLNGYVVEGVAAEAGVIESEIEYRAAAGLNTGHPITDGSTGREPVRRYFAFTGQAFIPAEGSTVLLTVPDGWTSVFTYRINTEIASGMRIDASGMAQGAALEYGEGRIALFGETGGFTAQIIDGTRKFGFNTPQGNANPEFILATLRWLARYSPDG